MGATRTPEPCGDGGGSQALSPHGVDLGTPPPRGLKGSVCSMFALTVVIQGRGGEKGEANAAVGAAQTGREAHIHAYPGQGDGHDHQHLIIS